MYKILSWSWLTNPRTAFFLALFFNLGVLIPIRLIQMWQLPEFTGQGMLSSWVIMVGNTIIIPFAAWLSLQQYKETGHCRPQFTSPLWPVIIIAVSITVGLIFFAVSARDNWSWVQGWRFAGWWNIIAIMAYVHYFATFAVLGDDYAVQGSGIFYALPMIVLVVGLGWCLIADSGLPSPNTVLFHFWGLF